MQKIYLIIIALFTLCSCNKLGILPDNIVQDKDAFASQGGVTAYFAGLYNRLPIEDFKYNMNDGYNQFNYILSINNLTGEMMNRNVGGATGSFTKYYADAYIIIRNANYFIQTLPGYAFNFNPNQVNHWLGEARFIRDFTYFELVKRYGGIPITTEVQYYPQESLEQLQLPRNSEQEVYDYIAKDLDSAILLMNPTSEQRGRANKYIAAALKSRAMLFAGSIAKYNTKNISDPNTGKQVQGIPATEAVRYFKASYEASKLVETGGYMLYRATANKEDNYYNLFFDVTASNKEVIFAKEYSDLNAVHSFDLFAIPNQMKGKDGYSSYMNPTLDYVELFDGLPRNADGTLKTIDATTGKYAYYDDRYAFFKNAEPRLLATVLMPGATFKGEVIDVRRGIYKGDISGGIGPFPGALPPYPNTTNPYANNPNMVPAVNSNNLPSPIVDLGNGQSLNAGGLSGTFNVPVGAGTISGFFQRKYLDQRKPVADVIVNKSFQPWIEMRYAEVLLNRAEADYELQAAGQTDANYQQDAFQCINDIRDRAGANLLASAADLNDINIIRNERRKELGFENKIWWDIKRWRTADAEIQNRVWMVLHPIYVAGNGKYIYDKRRYEGNQQYTFNPVWYYEPIPDAEITKNPKLVQNQ
ncbi:RagB/SusD family nutrient uptake outer membrane protein [Chitinophaga agrisoli]|uniref:RagB/SusD family nutrient uptake outer membrane protein n=1 Tax=Chitinophaga agrisoli TaxID=2607653 RepID=A0A5B2VK13_9BACT|nr:RagB/SusD family nutrient uptake outer membrane protein [Chitinophaga agrisoli]KAA2238930.1 RagB/SusD family nutrient uptake outer membrane protein [Chitinophaga agrisoli]